MTAKIKAPSPPRAITSVILSMGLLAIGNGLLFSFIPVQLAEKGFPPWVAGTIVTAMSAGGLVACLVAGLIVRRVGHARAFATMTAFVILSVLMIALGTYPVVWVAARALYGFAAAGLFIISQSWLNDACVNEWRGKVIGLFYMVYVISVGSGAFLLRFVPLDGATIPLLGIFFATLALLPICLTRLQTPPPPASITIAVRSVWRISPVGLVGLLAVGGLTMLLQGFGPIYVAAEGYSKNDVGTLVFLMQFGMIAVQYPLGALSDRIDRRHVLFISCLLVIVAALVATQASLENFVSIVIIFAVWSGATESILHRQRARKRSRRPGILRFSLQHAFDRLVGLRAGHAGTGHRADADLWRKSVYVPGNPDRGALHGFCRLPNSSARADAVRRDRAASTTERAGAVECGTGTAAV